MPNASIRILLVAIVFCATTSFAQERQFAGEVTGGSSWFLDEDFPAHLTVGGSFRAYLTEKVSVGPEFLYLRADESDQDYIFAGNVAYDFGDPASRVIPFVAGGVGVFHHRNPFFSTTDLTGIAGAGARFALTERLFLAPQFRVGIEPEIYLLATVSFGIVLSGGR